MECLKSVQNLQSAVESFVRKQASADRSAPLRCVLLARAEVGASWEDEMLGYERNDMRVIGTGLLAFRM